MPSEKHPVPKTERERRVRWVQIQRVAAGEIDVPEDASACARRPTTPAQRKRIVEVLALEAGLPLPTWGAARGRPEPIDTSTWDASRAASIRAQHQRFGRYGLAFARDGTIRCVKCKEVVLAIPRDRPLAMGTPVSALAARHAQATGCR